MIIGDGGRGPTLDDLFRRAGVRHPHALALADAPDRERFTDGAQRTLTYSQADRAISAFAAKLRGLGLHADTVVGLQLPNTVESVIALLGIGNTLALSIFNHDAAVASAAARMVSAAEGRPLIEMGSRRTHEYAAVAAARAAYIAGFAASSNLEAQRRYGVPTEGTSAHAFTMLHASRDDSPELTELAELLQAPVMTSVDGKSVFPEDHPLSLGAGGIVYTGHGRHYLDRADVVLGIGCSFTPHRITSP